MQNIELQPQKATAIFRQMAKWQLIATLSVTVLAFLVAGLHAGASAFAGGASAIIGGLAAARIAKRGENNKQAGAVLIGLLQAEAVKIFVIVTLLFLTFKIYAGHIVPLALICGLAASALLSGAAFYTLNKNND